MIFTNLSALTARDDDGGRGEEEEGDEEEVGFFQ